MYEMPLCYKAFYVEDLYSRKNASTGAHLLTVRVSKKVYGLQWHSNLVWAPALKG